MNDETYNLFYTAVTDRVVYENFCVNMARLRALLQNRSPYELAAVTYRLCVPGYGYSRGLQSHPLSQAKVGELVHHWTSDRVILGEVLSTSRRLEMVRINEWDLAQITVLCAFGQPGLPDVVDVYPDVASETEDTPVDLRRERRLAL